MSVRILIVMFLIAISVASQPSALAQSNNQCRWISPAVADPGSCQRFFASDSKKWQTSNSCDASAKGAFDNTCCCPVQTSKKYIIIGSLAAIFGIITVLSFALRKNETQ